MARSKGQSEVAVQRQSLIEGNRCARLRTEDSVNSKLIPFCRFGMVNRKTSTGARINHIGSLSCKLPMRSAPMRFQCSSAAGRHRSAALVPAAITAGLTQESAEAIKGWHKGGHRATCIAGMAITKVIWRHLSRTARLHRKAKGGPRSVNCRVSATRRPTSSTPAARADSVSKLRKASAEITEAKQGRQADSGAAQRFAGIEPGLPRHMDVVRKRCGSEAVRHRVFPECPRMAIKCPNLYIAPARLNSHSLRRLRWFPRFAADGKRGAAG